MWSFLSCQGGSARAQGYSLLGSFFLSCLGGSALEHIKINVLIVKDLWSKKAASPFFKRYR
jgi:hypothetical protein